MNDEIKEILDYFREYANLKDTFYLNKLESYITNLQEDYDRAMKLVDKGVENSYIKIKEQQKEIEKLTAESTEWESKCYDLQKRNEKAIEYIKHSIDNPQPFYEYLFGDENGKVENLDKLLNILQGEDNK